MKSFGYNLLFTFLILISSCSEYNNLNQSTNQNSQDNSSNQENLNSSILTATSPSNEGANLSGSNNSALANNNVNSTSENVTDNNENTGEAGYDQIKNNIALSSSNPSIDESISSYLEQELFNKLIESDPSVVKLKQELESSFQSRATNLSKNYEYASSTLVYLDNILIRDAQIEAALQATKKLENKFKARSKLSAIENKQVVANLLDLINKNQEELEGLMWSGKSLNNHLFFMHAPKATRILGPHNKLQRLKIILFTIIGNKFSEYENLLNLQEDYLLNLAKSINKQKINTLIPYYKKSTTHHGSLYGVVGSAYIHDNKIAGDLPSDLAVKVSSLKNEINQNSSSTTLDHLKDDVSSIKLRISAAQKESADTQNNISNEYTMNVINHSEMRTLGSWKNKEKYPTIEDYMKVRSEVEARLEAQSKVPALKEKLSALNKEIKSLREQLEKLAAQYNRLVKSTSNTAHKHSLKIQELGKEIVSKFIYVKYSEVEKKSISYKNLDIENLNNIIDNIEHRAIVHNDVNPIGLVDYKKIQKNYIDYVAENRNINTSGYILHRYSPEEIKYLFLSGSVPENTACNDGYGASVVTHGKIPVYFSVFKPQDHIKFSAMTPGKTMRFLDDSEFWNKHIAKSVLFNEKNESVENLVFHKLGYTHHFQRPFLLGSSEYNKISLFDNLLNYNNIDKTGRNHDFLVDSDGIAKPTEISFIDFDNDQFFDFDKNERSIGDVTWVNKRESFLLRSSTSSIMDPSELDGDHDSAINMKSNYYLSFYKINSKGQYSRIDRVKLADKKSISANFEIQYSEESKNAVIKIKHLIHKTPYRGYGTHTPWIIPSLNMYQKTTNGEYVYIDGLPQLVVNQNVMDAYVAMEDSYLKGLTSSIEDINYKYRNNKDRNSISIQRRFEDYTVSEIKVTSDRLQVLQSNDYNFYQGILYSNSTGSILPEHEKHFTDVENEINDMENSYNQLLKKNGLKENSSTEEIEVISDTLYVELMNKYFPYYMSKYGYTKYSKENKVKVENIAKDKYLFIDDQQLSRFVYTCK